MNSAKMGFLRCPVIGCLAAVLLWTGKVLALNATDTIQAEAFSGSSGVTTETCSEGGQDVTSIQNGSYTYYDSVNFGTSGIQCFEARIASYGNGGYIEVYLDSLAGTLACTCETRPATGAWQTWTGRTCRLGSISGVHTVYLKFTGGTGNLFSLNWFKFHAPQTFATAGWRSSDSVARGIWKGTITLAAASGTPTITVTPDTMYQRVEGFGGAFNDNGAHCIDTINRLSAGMGTAVMRELFDPVNGCRFNFGRVPIGCSDYTVTKNYTLDEIPSGSSATTDFNMQYFTIAHDSLFNIPYVKSAIQYQPNLMIYGTPWTPPSWMKNTDQPWGVVNNVTSTMDTAAQYLTAYALYFRKFVQAWQQKGISIALVCPQNEPTFQATYQPSCAWPGTGVWMRNFCRDYLCPGFTQNGISTEVWMGTFYENGFATDAGPTLADTQARKLILGCGLQRGGSAQMNQSIDTSLKYNLHWHAIQTENWSNDGLNTWTEAMNTFDALRDFWTNQTNVFNFWNMVLDSEPAYCGQMNWAQNSMVVVNPRAKPLPTVKYTGEFFTMKHYSYYVAVGAVRIMASSTNTSLTVVGFKNPDGSIILEVANNSSSAVSPVIKVGTQAFTPALPAMSANTFVLGGTPNTANWVPGTTAVQVTPLKRTLSPVSGTLGVYDMRGRLVKLLNSPTSGENREGMVWDRTDASGKKAAPGIYLIMNKAGKTIQTVKVLCK